MIVRVCTFTKQGEMLAHRIFDDWEEMIPKFRTTDVSLEEWTGECFQKLLPILFVGACGIAVRLIAPFVKDKLADSPVIVMDEKGEFVIPILSGHVGGANEIAGIIAKRIGATPVYTTATDVEGVFAVDVFARKNGLRIENREGIRRVSAKLLRGEEITIALEESVVVCGEMPKNVRLAAFDEPDVDVRIVTKNGASTWKEKGQELLLTFQDLVLGIGCKKGKTFEELRNFLMSELSEGWASDVSAVASIDLKKREEGLWELAQYYHLQLEFFSAAELENVEGTFTASSFVRSVTGVDNVCERAALKLAGEGGSLIRKKIAKDGMTLAVAKRRKSISFIATGRE